MQAGTRTPPVFYYDDWSPKPQLKAWEKLVLGEWRTDETLAVNDRGEVSLNAFHGDYLVETQIKDDVFKAEISLGPEKDFHTVTLSTDTKPQINTPQVRPALLGADYFAAIPVKGGEEPVSWELIKGPDWLSMREDGVLTGLPPALGSEEIQVRVSDSDGDKDDASFRLDIIDVPPVPASGK